LVRLIRTGVGAARQSSDERMQGQAPDQNIDQLAETLRGMDFMRLAGIAAPYKQAHFRS
jgi:hypothetical protein